MTRRAQLCLWLVLATAMTIAPGAGAQDSATVPVIEFDSTVDPASEKWIASALSDAAEDGAPLAIIRLDTPGGLDSSMREIVKDVIEAPMPVVVFVSPDGSRAASAGAFIAEAADVAAMSPQTNIGSASAVDASGGDIGGTLGRKIENDAAAFVRALAEAHGRNGAIAERMVTEADNFTAAEARAVNLVDVVAGDDEALGAPRHGVHGGGPKEGTLETTGLELDERETPFQYELLELLVNPTIAYLLLLAGLVGLAIELFSPGLFIPGTFGLVSFLLGAFGTAQLPVTAVGIALLVLGIALIIAEVHLPTSGVLGVLGVVSLAAAGLLLFDTGSEEFEVSAPAVIAVALALGGGLTLAVRKVVQAHRAQPLTGWEELIGATGDVRVPLDPVGQVFVQGALWRATGAEGAAGNAEMLRRRGVRVRVDSVEGLTLRVHPVPDEPHE